MRKKWKKMLAFLLSLSFVFSAVLPAVEAGDAPVERFSVPRNESLTLSVGENWTHVNWKIHDPRTNREYPVGQGNALAVNYAMARPLLHDGEVRLRAFGADPAGGGSRLIGTYFVEFTEPVYEVAPPLAPEISAPQAPVPEAQAASAPGGGARLLAEGDPVRLEVVYLYWDENNQLVMEDETHPRPIAPGWYLDEPDGNTEYQVTFHVIAGYLPYIQNDDGTLPDNSESSYTFTPENGAYAPEKVTVVYVPQEVNYTVEIYQESLTGEYELKKTATKQAKTGSQIDMDALCSESGNNPEGFERPYYREKPRVKGDNSTVAEIYLDRQYFLMDFTLGKGGYGVEPVYKKFEAPLSVDTPIRPGYTFLGWKLADENGNPISDLILSKDMPEEMPAENRLYIADWKMNSPANVTVNIWGEEANTVDYELIASNTIQAESDQQLTQEVISTALTEVDANLWTYEKTKPEQLPTVLPDGSTVVNVYYKRTLKTLTFNSVGGTVTKWVATDTKAEDWADGGNNNDRRPKWDEDYTWTYSQFMGGTKTVNVQALQTYLNENCPNPVEGQVVEYIYLAKKPGTWDDGKKTMHFVFHDGAWYVGEEQEVPIATITAKWGADIADEWLEVSNNANCHAWSEQPNGNYPWTSGVQVMFEVNKTYYLNQDSGYAQSANYYGENLDGSAYDLMYTNTAYYDGGLQVSDEDRLQFEGFTYDHGTANNQNFAGATFYYKRNTYKVIYVNSPNPNHEKDAKFGQSLNQAPYSNYTPDYPSNLQKDVYNFEGWYKDPSLSVKMDWNMEMPAKNITVYAKWSPILHEVTLRPEEWNDIPENPNAWVAHDSVIPENSPARVEAANIIDNPPRPNFEFQAWFYKKDGVEHAFKLDMPVNDDMDLYAKWKASDQWSYTVNYLLLGSSPENPVYVAEPAVGIGIPGDSFTVYAKHGYSTDHPSELFWEYWQFFTPTAESINVTLDEDKKQICFYYEEETAVINYVALTGGTVSPETDDTVGKVNGEPVGSIPTANAGYKFDGWYTGPDCTQKVPESWVGTDSKITPERTFDAGVPGTDRSTLWVFENKTYYAKFKELTVDIKYKPRTFDCNNNPVEPDNAGGSVSPETDHDIGMATGSPHGSAAAANAGYEFIGWYTDPDCTEVCNVSNNALYIPQRTGDPALYRAATYYAKFKERLVTIEYKAAPGDEEKGSVEPDHDTVGAVTGAPDGSVPDPADNCRFVGWYTDPDCEQPVDSGWVVDNKITPQKDGDLYQAATYYAKFESLVTINYVPKAFNCEDALIEDPAIPGGTVNPRDETVGEETGANLTGSDPTAKPGFDFVGWYTDEACTQSVDPGWVADSKITPKTGVNNLFEEKTYYAKFKEQSVTINYEAVVNPASPSGTEIGGRVSPETETICCVTGSPQGSTATADQGYTFSGWYTKNENEPYVPVSPEWITNKTTLTPQREDGLYKGTTYYAMFSKLPALKITKRIVGDFYSPDDIFVFTISKLDVEGNAAGAMNLTVRASEMAKSTNTEGKTVWETSVTLAALEPGEYSASEDTGWSWRYACSVTPTDGVVILSVDDKEAVEIVFENTLTNDKWLSCQCRAVNTYGENTVTFRENESDPVPASGSMVVTVAHGEQIPVGKIPAEPTKPDFDFVGWYYKKGENGTETAFVPGTESVTCNMNLYATWTKKQGGGP